MSVCNNGFDSSPTWEDATDAALAHHAHVFANKIKQNTKWGVNVRVNLTRNGAIGDCYLSGIGGNFE